LPIFHRWHSSGRNLAITQLSFAQLVCKHVREIDLALHHIKKVLRGRNYRLEVLRELKGGIEGLAVFVGVLEQLFSMRRT